MGVAHSLTSKVPLPSLSYLFMIAEIGSSPKPVPVAFAMSSAADFMIQGLCKVLCSAGGWPRLEMHMCISSHNGRPLLLGALGPCRPL